MSRTARDGEQLSSTHVLVGEPVSASLAHIRQLHLFMRRSFAL